MIKTGNVSWKTWTVATVREMNGDPGHRSEDRGKEFDLHRTQMTAKWNTGANDKMRVMSEKFHGYKDAVVQVPEVFSLDAG